MQNEPRSRPEAGISGEAEGHLSVLTEEVLRYLAPCPGGRYLDGTVGLGGHSLEIMRATEGRAEILGLDQDSYALGQAKARLVAHASGIKLVKSRFSCFGQAMDEAGWDLLDGALLDLGVSSPQLDQAERGFSFLRDGPLDMRMNPEGDRPPAWEWLERASVAEIRQVIRELGEEPLAGRIASAIDRARVKSPIKRTLELAEVVRLAYPSKMRATARNHPATRTFQALRLKINDELDELSDFLGRIASRLGGGARLVIISFHSLEDRLVKRSFRQMAASCICAPQVPVCSCGHSATARILTKKPIMAGPEELAGNTRSRSAKLRAIERI